MNTLRNVANIAILRDCTLPKFFKTSSMWMQLPLLTRITEWWDPRKGYFHMGDQTLMIEHDDIYFVTGLSWRGQLVRLRGVVTKVGDNIDALIA